MCVASYSAESNRRKQSRKPKKDEICHVLVQPKGRSFSAPTAPSVTAADTGHPHLGSPTHSSVVKFHTPPPLNQPSVPKPTPPRSPLPSMLTPVEYERLGLPTGYIFWPTANVFIHTTTMFTSLLPVAPSSNDITSSGQERTLAAHLPASETGPRYFLRSQMILQMPIK